MKRLCVLLAVLLGGTAGMTAQHPEQFSIASLNVDGLPQKVLVLKVNADGPGDSGSARIGKYLLQKSYDLVLMQEDFNYHGVITALLEDDYHLDEWSGDVGLDGHSIDFLHLQNHRFECDGLMACWKKDLMVTPSARIAWKQNFGKFSHANDEMVTKGFRRYEVTLRDGTHVVVYNMHMDASDDEDEATQNDVRDKEARMAQWAQLKADVLQQLGSLPVVIVGDMNSLYGRDNVKAEFIEAINDTGRGMVSDVWVELQQANVYPADRAKSAEAGEMLDKVLYINPVAGAKIKPVAFSIDKEGYMYNGKPLGDHFPVAVTFEVLSDKSEAADIQKMEAQTVVPSEFYNLKGQRTDQPQTGLYIERNGEKTYKRIVK